jgi:hypothetical protein
MAKWFGYGGWPVFTPVERPTGATTHIGTTGRFRGSTLGLSINGE